jgi:hypothetical protein
LKTRMMRKIAVLVTGSALALALPITSSFADTPSDGNGHSGACDNQKIKSQGHGPKPNSQRKGEENGKGWKCGLSNAGLTAAS